MGRYIDRRTGKTYDELPEWAMKVSDAPEEYLKEYYSKYGSSTAQPNAGNLLDKADAREVEIAEADDKIHKLFGTKSWLEFLGTQATGATAALGASYALPWLGQNILPYMSANGYLGLTLAAGTTPTWLNPTSAAFIDATLMGIPTGESVNDMIHNGPNLGNVLGVATGAAGLTSLTVANYPKLFQTLVTKFRHPTYKKYYHGTSANYNIKDAKMGSTYNSGLHVSGTPEIAEAMKHRGNGSNPHVEEFWAPKPSTETIDVWDNGIRLLSTNYTIEPRVGSAYYDAAGNNTFKFNLIRKLGGNPVPMEGKPAFQLESPVTLDLRKASFPKIPQSKLEEIDNLLKEYLNKVNWDEENIPLDVRSRLAEINKRAAEIMSESGYKVVKYNNVNPYEGSGGASYIITDPSIIYTPPIFNPNAHQYTTPLSVWETLLNQRNYNLQLAGQ